VDFRMHGSDELAAVARRFRDAGDRGLSKQFRAGLNQAARPAVEATRRGFRDRLPSKGGLNERIASGKITSKVTTRADGGELVITASAGVDMPALDGGRLRHPVHGHRDRWVEQHIRPGALTDTMQEHAPKVFDEVVEAAFDMLDKL